jgi:D-arabinose 1-dehydrogenase-like Zn-dependent alcohol dehydrogenase
MLNMHKWRRRQVNAYLLPRTSDDRRKAKRQAAALLAARDVTRRENNAQLNELRRTILDTQTQSEIPEKLEQALGNIGTNAQTGRSQGPPPFADVTYTAIEDSRFAGDPNSTSRSAGATATLATKNPQKIKESTLRELTRLDGK